MIVTRYYRFSGKWMILCSILSLHLGACSSQESGPHIPGHANGRPPHESENIGEFASPTNQIVISDQATVQAAYARDPVPVPVQGYITYDIRRNKQVAARVGGRIEKLYVRYQNQYVRRGDKIMELYSPELNTFQEELLFLLRSGADPWLLEQGREKLRLLGLSRAQVHNLEKRGSHAYSITIYSPYPGFIQLPPLGGQPPMGVGGAAAAGEGGSMGAMGGGPTPPVSAPAGETLREGAYLNPGQVLFTINDLEQVWAVLSFDTGLAAQVQEKDEVQLFSEMMPERQLAGRVGLVEPIFARQQKFMQARAYLPNPGRRLKINSLVSGSILPRAGQQLVVPLSSVYDLGRRKIVWVWKGQTPQGHKRFEARQVITGAARANHIPIVAGLDRQERIARDAGYLVDSESFIQVTTTGP